MDVDLKKGSKISKIATNNKNTLAVRFPKHPVTRHLLKKLNFPLAAPSANLSSRVSSVSSDDVKEDFGKKIKYILEGGKSSIGIESTIIDLRNKPKILRLGGLDIFTIQRALKKKIIINNNTSKISAPGQFKLHYSPGIPIRLNVNTVKDEEAYVLINKKKVDAFRTSYISFLSEHNKNDFDNWKKRQENIIRNQHGHLDDIEEMNELVERDL